MQKETLDRLDDTTAALTALSDMIVTSMENDFDLRRLASGVARLFESELHDLREIRDAINKASSATRAAMVAETAPKTAPAVQKAAPSPAERFAARRAAIDLLRWETDFWPIADRLKLDRSLVSHILREFDQAPLSGGSHHEVRLSGAALAPIPLDQIEGAQPSPSIPDAAAIAEQLNLKVATVQRVLECAGQMQEPPTIKDGTAG